MNAVKISDKKKRSKISFRKAIKVLGFKTYADYLASDHWKDTCRLLKGKVCYCCRQGERLQLHHKSYANIGKETEWDVVTVCDSCHSKIHSIEGGGAKLDRCHKKLRAQIKYQNRPRR